MTLDLQKIRATVHADRIRWRYHALGRAAERGIARELALRVLKEGEILEQHPYTKPFPKCLMMMTVEPNRPLYVALAYDKEEDYLYIITVHWLDPSKWEDPWTRRPRRTPQRRTHKP